MATINNEKHCFVIMPFGEKKDVGGKVVNFNDIYDDFIKPMIENEGIKCTRCDKVDEAGNIHRKMFEHIWDADVAIVDLSLLNPNVFYELGIRHALKKSITILIRRKGTNVPFNISNLTVVEYDEKDADRLKTAKSKIIQSIEAGYQKGHTDNYVSEVLDLKIMDAPKPITYREVFEYSIESLNQKRICIITGDLRDVHGIDIWVNSENTNMQMARYYDFSVSSVIRYESAKKTKAGRVNDDIINNELVDLMDGESSVPAAHVISTSSGQLEKSNGVKTVFHAAAVEGSIGKGYRAISSIEDCVTNSLKLADSDEFKDQMFKTILFPLFGIGTRLKSERQTVRSLFAAAIGYLLNYPDTKLEKIYFLAWSENEFELCKSILDAEDRLKAII